jgi:hypothetical protein
VFICVHPRLFDSSDAGPYDKVRTVLHLDIPKPGPQQRAAHSASRLKALVPPAERKLVL